MLRYLPSLPALLLAVLCAAVPARASIGLVVGEPFGSFGTMMPVGHAGVYLDHICADSPTRVRLCAPGEQGIIVSRYHDLKPTQIDWLAMPLIPFLYGVGDARDTPTVVSASLEAELREDYWRAHLTSVAPGRVDAQGNLRPPPYGDWEEGVGAAFDRRLFLYVIDTTPAQDAAILAYLQASANHRRYTLRRRNCADFAADLLRIALPGAIHRNVLGDFDLMTPKQLARTLDTYGQAHPEAHLRVYEVPQIPGSLRRSRPIRGSAETFVKTKRYLATLLIIQPEALLLDWIDYEAFDKWPAGLDATPITPTGWPLSTAAADNTAAAATPSENAQ